MPIREEIKKFIDDGKARHASDIHLCANSPVMYRIGKSLKRASQGVLPPALCKDLCISLLTEPQRELFEKTRDIDFMLGDDEGRYRVNISVNAGNVGAVIRLLPQQPHPLDELKLPEIVREFSHRTKGLVLITGSTGQGKTTTMSAMIDEVNRTERKHIITIEDPVEAVHENIQGIVRQREVGKDTQTFASALRAALRQDPDVIAIGEMRDYETIRIALTAAETGVLVLSTLHVISIDKIIERLLSYTPPDEEGHIRNLLADCLQGIIHQELLPTPQRSKRVACEILVATNAVRNIIRHRGTFMLRSIIQTGQKSGMVTMAQSVGQLINEGAIEPEVADAVLFNYAM